MCMYLYININITLLHSAQRNAIRPINPIYSPPRQDNIIKISHLILTDNEQTGTTPKQGPFEYNI